jgi:hypothetical protein
VLKAAIQNGDLAATEHNLTTEWAVESLYGAKVRRSTVGSLQSILEAASLAMSPLRGVRVVSDHLLPTICRSDEYQKIFEPERELGRRPEFAAVARYTHCLAHRAGSVTRNVS